MMLMNSKNLHKHAVPIVGIIVAGLIAVVGLTTYSVNKGISGSDLSQLMTNRAVDITHTGSGLTVDVSWNQNIGQSNTLPNPQTASRSLALDLALE